MSYYNLLNTSNFTFPSFSFNFGCWSLPSFSWQNNFLYNSFNKFTSWNNNLENNTWTNSYSPPVGDTFSYTYNPPKYDFSYTPSFTQTYTTAITASYSPPQLNFGAKTYKNNFSDESNQDFLRDYNAQKGRKLATTALDNSTGWSGYCAKYVKTAIKDSGLGSYTSGHAYQMTDILENNSNFKQISTTNVNVNDLPAGCVLVYDRGAQGYSSNYGHVEITTGDGRGVSDGITNNLRKPSAIFIPV